MYLFRAGLAPLFFNPMQPLLSLQRVDCFASSRHVWHACIFEVLHVSAKGQKNNKTFYLSHLGLEVLSFNRSSLILKIFTNPAMLIECGNTLDFTLKFQQDYVFF